MYTMYFFCLKPYPFNPVVTENTVFFFNMVHTVYNIGTYIIYYSYTRSKVQKKG